jgi:3-keto-L-gulonate-6-phosphate decarboxylase
LRATSGFSVVGSAAADDATINKLQELINKKHFNYYLVNQFRVFNKNRISLKLKTLMASIAVFHRTDAVFIASMQCF